MSQPDTDPAAARFLATIGMTPDAALRVFREKEALAPSVRWSELMHQAHATQFTVAKVARLDLLAKIRASLDAAIANGQSFDQWRAGLQPELERAGWWGLVRDKSLTGTAEPVFIGQRRLRTIFRTNTQMAWAAGEWRRIQRDKDIRPYLIYESRMDGRERPLHHLWNGTILPVDHPWWQTHFPPCGWNCRCRARQIGDAYLTKHGLKLTKTPPEHGTRTFHAVSGEDLQVPVGIDPGFGYNPGTAHLRAIADKATRSLDTAARTGLTDQARQTLSEIIADPAFDQFMAMPDGHFPVAILDRDFAAAISARSQVVVLPKGVYLKQQGLGASSAGHAELTVAEYRLLPDIIDQALLVVDEGEGQKLIFFTERATGKLWRVVIRQDDTEPFPAIVSFHRDQTRALKRFAVGDTRILLDRRAGGVQ